MAHIHPVYDTDTHFSINALTREIKAEPKQKVKLIQHDHNSERFTFSLPRYIEGHDMSICNVVEVHFLNIETATKAKNTGLYTVSDLQVSPEDDSKVTCSWLISQNATQLAGALHFLLKFKCVNGDIIEYAWNTDVYKNIVVSDGINADESFEEEYVDIIAQWKAEAIQDITEAVNANVTAALQDSIVEYRAEFNKALSVERARIDNIVALPEGSTTGDAELMDGRIDYVGKNHGNIGEHIREVTGNLAAKINNIRPVYRGNLYDKASNTVDGYYIQTETGAFEEYADAKYALIPLGNSAEYVFSKTFGTVLMIGENDDIIEARINLNDIGTKKTLTNTNGATVTCVVLDNIPVNAKYVAINIRLGSSLDYQDTFYFGTEADYKNGANECYGLYGKGIEDTKARGMINSRAASVLHGKVLAVIGDSLTEGINPDGGYFDSYGQSTAERHGMTFLNYGISGSTLQDIAGHDGFSNANRYQNMVDHIDYMTIWFGWNDHAYGTVGINSDTDATKSFYGAWHTVIPHLIDKYPTAKIGLIVPYGANEAYRQAVRDIACFYGLGLLDLYDESGRIPMLWGNNKCNWDIQQKRRITFTYDGCHLNQAGHDYFSSIYEHFLLSL